MATATDNRFEGLDPVAQEARQRLRAKAMRSEPTDAEKRLWSLLRAGRLGGFKFRRQCPIGAYIADFACPLARLIVEADGSQHIGSETDARRTSWLNRQGWRVIRFTNRDILGRPSDVAYTITAALTAPLPPTPAAWAPPSPARGEGQELDHA